MGSWKPSIHLVVFTLFWGALVLSRKTRRHSVNSRKYYRTLYIPLEVFFSCAFNIALPDDSVTQTAQPSNTEESNDDLEDEVSFWRFLSLSKPKAGSEKPQSEKVRKPAYYTISWTLQSMRSKRICEAISSDLIFDQEIVLEPTLSA